MHRDSQTAGSTPSPPITPGHPGESRRSARQPSARLVQPGARFVPPSARCVAAAALAAVLAAMSLSCATIGNRFPPENVAHVKIGETTKAQLLGDFGLPYRRGIEDGDSTWTYVYYKVRLFGENLRTRDLYLRFDADGRVKSYTYNSNLDD